MKLTILFAMAWAGFAGCALGQQIILDNIDNDGGPSATSGGLVYWLPGSGPSPTNHFGPLVLFDGYNYNLGVTVYGGPDPSHLTLMGTFTPANDPKGYTGFDLGKFQLGPPDEAVTVPGVAPGGMAWIELQMWDYDSPYATGTFQNLGDALDHLDLGGSVIFQNPTSDPTGSPPMPPPDLIGMPSVSFVLIPEPATLALAGLGLASLWALRRRNA
jgi:hypothetical protein